MSSKPKTLSRRTVLRGGSVALALPFLEAMIPSFAHAQSSTAPKRFVVAFGGTAMPAANVMTPAAGVLPATLPGPWSGLSANRQLFSIVSGLAIPQYTTGTPPPGACYNMQHYTTPQTIMTGTYSIEASPHLVYNHSVDQHVADAIGGTTRFKSVQARVQAALYQGSLSGKAGILSARKIGTGPVQSLQPIVSPLELFTSLFSAGLPNGTPNPTPTLSLALRKQKSVLDSVIDDANRLMASVGSDDKARLDQHFTEIRNLEKSLIGTGVPAGPVGTGCSMPAKPGADIPYNTLGFGGWADETTRGDQMAEILALALACDLTRAVSWMLTADQCFMGSHTISGKQTDMHDLTHVGTSADREAHVKWHAERWMKLVQRLSTLQEGAGTVLDNTFLTLVFAEGIAAHNRTHFNYLVAGRPSFLKMGQSIPANGAHPAQLMIAGMQSVGMTQNTLGQISNVIPGMLK